jgi:DNA recombination protein RmuC
MDMTVWILVGVVALALAAGAAVAAWVVARRGREAGAADAGAALQLLQQQILGLQSALQEQVGGLTRTLNEQLQQGQKTIGERLEGATRVVAQVHGQLGALAKTAENMQEMGRSLGELQNILRAPKLRGLMGETMLGELLRQVLPDSAYTLQHGFRSGARADAVIRLGEGLVPIDAKFPLEAFNRMIKAEGEEARRLARREFIASVRARIDEIADKYILPDEGTYDFALMYIPAENIFYEVIVREQGAADFDLCAYALERRVVPVSPNSFYAYLMAIAHGLKGMRIEKEARAVFDRVRDLQQKFGQFLETFGLVGKQIGHAQNNFEQARRQAERLQDGIGTLGGVEAPGGIAEAPGRDAALPLESERPEPEESAGPLSAREGRSE